MVNVTALAHGVATHAADDLVLATGISGGADCVVTGDKKLQRLGSYQGMLLLSPATFLRLLATGRPD